MIELHFGNIKKNKFIFPNSNPNYLIEYSGFDLLGDKLVTKKTDSGTGFSIFPTLTITALKREICTNMIMFNYEMVQSNDLMAMDVFNTFDKCNLLVRDFDTGIYERYNGVDVMSSSNGYSMINIPKNIINQCGIEKTIDSTYEIKIEFISSSMKSTKVAMYEVLMPTFESIGYINRLKYFSLHEEINVLSDDLPLNTCDFTAEITDGKLLQENIAFDVYKVKNNAKKYYGRFLISDFEQISNNLYDVKSYDIRKSLDTIPYEEDVSTGWHSILDFVLELSYLSEVPIYFDYAPKTHMWGFLPTMTCRQALCNMGFATNSIITSARTNYVEIMQVPFGISSTITNGDKRILGQSKVKKNTLYSSAVVKQNQYWRNEIFNIPKIEHKETVIEVSKADVPNKIYFSEVPSTASVSAENVPHVKIIKQTGNYFIYTSDIDNAEILVITDVPSTFVFSVNSTIPIKNDEVYTIDKINYYGREIPESDTIAQDNTHYIRSEILKRYIESNGTITSKIVLKNEMVGTGIKLETAYNGIHTGIITSMDLHLGYDDIADVEVLIWDLTESKKSNVKLLQNSENNYVLDENENIILTEV